MWKLFIGLLIMGLLPLQITDKASAASPTATMALSDSNLAAGETATVTITFSEAVTGFTIADMTAENGTLSGLATENNKTYTATLTPAAGINSPTNIITLNNAGVTDNLGNAGSGTTQVFYSIDSVQPTVQSVTVPAVGYYGVGRNLDFTVHMSEPVVVTGTPSMALVIGATTVQAAYVSGSGTDALLFRYTVQPGQTDADGISVGTLALIDGSIKDIAGNNAELTLYSVGSTVNVTVDTTTPQIISVAVPNAATYKTGDSLDFAVTMSKNITVTGTPQLTLNIGGVNRAASYASTESSDILHFRYTVQAGDQDNDGIAIEALSLNGGFIEDTAGNDADLTLNNVDTTSGVAIDAAAPTITGYALGTGNAYFDLTFSEGIFTTSSGTGAVTPSDFRLNFNRNGGGASAVSIDSLEKIDGGDLTGGETAIRVMLDVTGTPDGQETIEIMLADGASIYDRVGNAVVGSQSSGTVTLLDRRAPFLSPTSASFDKYAGASANRDVTTTLMLNGNTLTGIANGATPLVSGTDYTMAGNVVTIKKSYLAAQPNGTTSLTFTFSDGSSQTLTITVIDSAPATATPSIPTPELPAIDLNGVSLDPASIDTTKPSVTLQVTPKDGAAYVSIPASILTSIEGKNATFLIEIKAPYGSYQVPVNLASLIPGLQDLLAKNNLQAEDISFKITLTDKSDDNGIQTALATGLPNGKVIGAIVDFHMDIVNAKTGQTLGTADKFNQAITRVIPMPKSMTVMPEQWGAFRYNETTKQFEFVPAKKVQIDGVWYAMIRSYSNSTYLVADNEASFADVKKHWAQPFVEQAAAKGLINGVGGGKYDPDKTVTRAEFTAMLVRALGRGASTSTSPYDDVKPGAWYFDEIAQAKELGLLSFTNDKSFKPDQPLTREEMASMLAEAVALEKLPTTEEIVSLDGYKDIGSVDAAYLEDVRLMVKLQIMTGTSANSFSPKGATTRAQAAVVLIRTLQALGMMD